MSGRCLWSISVTLRSENVCEIYISDGAREGLEKMVSSKFLEVISRQSNFGRLEKCLKKQNNNKKQQ